MLRIEYLALLPFFPYPHSSSLTPTRGTPPRQSAAGDDEEEEARNTRRRRRRMVCDAKRRRVRLLQPSASALHLDAASPLADGSFSYFRLPADPLLRLSVLKLDGSSFDVQVARTARVRELKEAIECLFSRPSKDATASWSHVWGHFCLCYNEHRLTDDKAYLRNFGIKDGDQLHFIRHLSFDHRPGKGRRPINRRTDMEQHRMSFTGSKFHDEVEVNDTDRDHNGVGSTEYVDEQYDLDDNDSRIRCTEFKFGDLFRGWLSYSRLRTSQRTKSWCRFVPNLAESPKVGSK